MPDSGSIIRTFTQIGPENECEPESECRFRVAEQQLRQRRVTEAIANYTEAERLGYDPDRCAGARWVAHMLLGDFARAWQESQAIEDRGNPDPNRFWNGKCLTGQRVLVRCLHGLGDTIQYARFLPLLRERAAFVCLEAQPPLKSLLSESLLADQVMTWKEAEPAWDVQVEIVELPRIFGAQLSNLPASTPYLKAPPAKLSRGAGKLHVGLVWASGAYNPARCIPLRVLSEICETPGCEFFSFQAGAPKADLTSCRSGIRDLGEQDGPVLQTASRLTNMDLVITVDTMMAHLAGALGIPVWTLLPFEADWRWMLGRSDSPWYPTMRLFRQPEPGDWKSVVDQVRVELTAAAARAA